MRLKENLFTEGIPAVDARIPHCAGGPFAAVRRGAAGVGGSDDRRGGLLTKQRLRTGASLFF